MKTRLAGLAVLAFAIAGIAGGTASAHQSSGCITGLVTVGTGEANQPTLYIHQEGGVWVYAETNAHKGLQTGGPTVVSTLLEDPRQNDACFNHNCKPATVADKCPAVASDTGIL